MAESDTSIQGYSGGFFWERDTLAMQKKEPLAKAANVFQEGLFN
jgi:hypothetical protein